MDRFYYDHHYFTNVEIKKWYVQGLSEDSQTLCLNLAAQWPQRPRPVCFECSVLGVIAASLFTATFLSTF